MSFEERGSSDPGWAIPGELQENIAALVPYANPEEEAVLLRAMRHTWFWQLEPMERSVYFEVGNRIVKAAVR